jgi:hypothetical protein
MTLEHAKEQGQAQYDSIRKRTARLNDDPGNDRARDAVHEDALCVRIRSGWYDPGADRGEPEEFEILLCTGGPAVRLIGKLNQYGEPETARMQVQDWFEPWTDFVPAGDEDCGEVLLTYARCFYFGQ